MNQQENSEIINSINEIKNALCNFNQRPNQEEKISFSFSLSLPYLLCVWGLSQVDEYVHLQTKCQCQMSFLATCSTFTGTGSHWKQISSIPKDGKPRDGHVTTNSTNSFEARNVFAVFLI